MNWSLNHIILRIYALLVWIISSNTIYFRKVVSFHFRRLVAWGMTNWRRYIQLLTNFWSGVSRSFQKTHTGNWLGPHPLRSSSMGFHLRSLIGSPRPLHFFAKKSHNFRQHPTILRSWSPQPTKAKSRSIPPLRRLGICWENLCM